MALVAKLLDNNKLKCAVFSVPGQGTWILDWVMGKIDLGDGLGFRNDIVSPSRVNLLTHATAFYVDVDCDLLDVYFETQTIDKILPLETNQKWWYDLHEYANKRLYLDASDVAYGTTCGVYLWVSGVQQFGAL